jgi:FAD/FMN-containing dehydrogenase
LSGKHKGNTVEAIQEILSSYAEGLELDIRLSKDGVPFAYHGDTLEEATTGHGIPETMTWKQLQQISYQDTSRSKLLSLEDIFKLIGSQKFIFLDIKSDKLYDVLFAQKIAALIKHYHLEETVIVESLNPFFLISMRWVARDILVMYDFTVNGIAQGEEGQSQFDKIPWLLKQPFVQKQFRRIIRPDILGSRWDLAESDLKSLIKQGYPIVSWTVDDPVIAQNLFRIGVKGVQTNNIQAIMAATPQEKEPVYDAGGSQDVETVIHITQIQDVLKSIARARSQKKKVTMAGRRHSMGGQTLAQDGILLNMLGLDTVVYNESDKTMRVGGGATWKKIQNLLNRYGRSVNVMQSDNIFSVGGSISANVHGWQAGSPPIAASILSMKMITADGKLREISNLMEPELFQASIGGYGQFGVITEAVLTTVPNDTLQFHAEFMKPESYTKRYQEVITHNPKAQLAYGRLSVDQENLFDEIGLFWYEKVDEDLQMALQPEAMAAIKRGVFRSSQYFELGKKMRWKLEKIDAKRRASEGFISRNNAMNTDIHILWPLYGQNKDILHEYFVPKNKLTEFLASLKSHVKHYQMNILNVTIREVRKDTISMLAYAKEDMFAIVCLFSQGQNQDEERKMKAFTQNVIDSVLEVRGTFYLPYRLHYTPQQVHKAYPRLPEWLALKKKWDPEGIFSSQFFDYINTNST